MKSYIPEHRADKVVKANLRGCARCGDMIGGHLGKKFCAACSDLNTMERQREYKRRKAAKCRT